MIFADKWVSCDTGTATQTNKGVLQCLLQAEPRLSPEPDKGCDRGEDQPMFCA